METLGNREKQKKENKLVYFPKLVSISSPDSSCDQLWTQTSSDLCDLCQLRPKPDLWWPCPVTAPSARPQCRGRSSEHLGSALDTSSCSLPRCREINFQRAPPATGGLFLHGCPLEPKSPSSSHALGQQGRFLRPRPH